MARWFAVFLAFCLAWPAHVDARFLSVDPVSADAGGGAHFNRYWYADDNPYRFVDPDGRQSMGPAGYGFYPAPTSFFRDHAVGRFIGQLVGDPIALARADNFNPITRETLGPRQVQDAKLGIVLLAIPVARTGRGVAQIADDALVVRGGSAAGANSAEGLAKGSAMHPSGATGFSVESGSGMTLCQLCANMPVRYNQIGVTSAGAIRAAGGDVVRTSGQSSTHATVTGLPPATASRLLTPTQPNPLPKPGTAAP
jgi:hypothetical protein